MVGASLVGRKVDKRGPTWLNGRGSAECSRQKAEGLGSRPSLHIGRTCGARAIDAVSHDRTSRASFLHSLAERAAWCRTCGNQFAAGAAENFWSVYRADEYAVTARSNARIRLSMSHCVAHGVNTKPRRKGGWTTAITSALTALARPPA